MTEQGGEAPKFNRVTASGTMAMARSDMAPHDFRWEEIAHTSLYRLSLQRIIII
ncbi:melibiose:sodium symporter [Vibrio mediterranei AK1]|nr:melibiose:sodium symporter [Vibrio mediterranei AK1]